MNYWHSTSSVSSTTLPIISLFERGACLVRTVHTSYGNQTTLLELYAV